MKKIIILVLLVGIVFAGYLLIKKSKFQNDEALIVNKYIGVKLVVPEGWELNDEKGFKESQKLLFAKFNFNDASGVSKAKINLNISVFDEKSRMADEIARSGNSIENMVSDLSFDHMTGVVNANRGKFEHMDFSGINGMRGPFQSGIFDKTGQDRFMWHGKLVIGFKKNKWIKIEAYPVIDKDQEAREIAIKGLNDLLSELEID